MKNFSGKPVTVGLLLFLVSLSAIQCGHIANAQGTEEIWLDTYDAATYPTVFSTNLLQNQQSYKITIEGTWSNWPSTHWTNVERPPVGNFEDAPLYPGQDGGEKTGKVGLDPFWTFASVFGEDFARSGNNWPLPARFWFKISLDNGASWSSSIRPQNDVYSPTHRYEVIVIGQGEKIGFRIPDLAADDNYGMLKIRVESYSEDAIEPAGGLPLEYILLALGLIAVVAVLIIFFVFKRRRPKTQDHSGKS